MIEDTVTLDDNEELQVTRFNFPNPTPTSLVHQTTFVTRHGFYLRFETQALRECQTTDTSTMLSAVRFSDIYNSEHNETQLCSDYSETPVRIQSFFHTFKLRYEVFNDSVSSIRGRVTAVPGT